MKMKFEYFAGEQRTPEWYKIRLGKVTASRLADWLAVSKAKASAGKPLKARLDYEKELLFEKKFNTSFEKWVSDAMQDGIDYEEYARKQYEMVTGATVKECGCWYSDVFVASPDGLVVRPDTANEGLLEIKIVKDNSFMDGLVKAVDKKDEPIPAMSENGALSKWWKQVQGQLWASGKPWCDFVLLNFNTKKIKIIRVMPDKDFHEWIELTINEDFHTDMSVFDDSDLYDLKELPPVAEPIASDEAPTEIKGF